LSPERSPHLPPPLLFFFLNPPREQIESGNLLLAIAMAPFPKPFRPVVYREVYRVCLTSEPFLNPRQSGLTLSCLQIKTVPLNVSSYTARLPLAQPIFFPPSVYFGYLLGIPGSIPLMITLVTDPRNVSTYFSFKVLSLVGATPAGFFSAILAKPPPRSRDTGHTFISPIKVQIFSLQAVTLLMSAPRLCYLRAW